MTDLLIIGDSHARAIANGAAALGLDVASYANSAGAWRDGAVKLSKVGSFASPRPRARMNIKSFEDAAGGKAPLFSGAPVIASLVFDVPQFVSDFRWHKLGSYLTEDHGAKHERLMSSRFTRAYLREQRREMLEGLKVIATKAPLLIVVPPVFRTWPLQRALKAELSQLVKDAGLALYDPNEHFADDKGLIPDSYKHEDGQHGNPAFGEAVLSDILKKGLLPISEQRRRA